MAAILCRLCFVEPCKALAKCCEGCGSCVADSCECFANCCGKCCSVFDNCCDFITSFCDKPFSGCLFTAVTINAIAGIFGVVAITSGGDQCDEPLLILAVILLVCAVINALFGIYTYHTVNNDADNALFNPEMSPSERLWQFVKYDLWMAAYILFIVALIVLLCITVGKAASCSSDIGRGVEALCIVLFIYLGIGVLICTGYVAVDALKEWSTECCLWLLPCLWPCLLLGCCLRAAEDAEKDWKQKHMKENREQVVTYSPEVAQPAPVVVVHQPPAQQQVAPVATYPQQPVSQRQQPYVEQPYYAQTTPQQPMQVTQPYNPQAVAAGPAPVQPGILVVNQDNQQAVAPEYEAKESAGPGHDRRSSKELKQIALEKSKAAAAATGKGAKKAGVAAIGWMSKKMNDLNEKVQEDKAAKKAQQEGAADNTR